MRAVAAAGWANASHPAPTARKARVTTTATDNALMPSLDDLIRPGQERRWDRQTEGLGGLEVDDELELGRLLDGEVARLSTFEDLVDVASGAPKQIGDIRAVGHQALGFDKLPQLIHRWEPVPGRQ